MTAKPPSIVVLTGAGISAESGIRTFRASDGLWEEHRIEEVATPEGFCRNPQLVHRFYNERRRQLSNPEIRPNAAHLALAAFERNHGGDFLLVTQNIDNLHERAGSRQLLHMHGELLKLRCQISERVFPAHSDVSLHTPCPCCGQAGNLRPDVVWFGEMPYHMERIHCALQRCDLFVAIGTSGNVYPAAGFHETARLRGAETVEINLEPTASCFDQHISGCASSTVPQFFGQLAERYAVTRRGAGF